MVTYLPPRSRSGAQLGQSLLQEAVLEGPEFARSGQYSTRWHIVRSAIDRLHTWDGQIHRSYHYWCGPFGHGFRTITTNKIPQGEPLCGTCYGRREGYDPERPELLFTPQMKPPKRCPGSQRRWFEEVAWNIGRCYVCSEYVRLRGFGSPYCPDWGAQIHEPGEGLIEGCEFHGWRELTLAQTDDGEPTVACRCKCIERSRNSA